LSKHIGVQLELKKPLGNGRFFVGFDFMARESGGGRTVYLKIIIDSLFFLFIIN